MTLLFDENLSPRLVPALADLFPESAHVDLLGMGGEPDPVIWEYAKRHGYILVSKDSDFHERSLLYGRPPKVVWIGFMPTLKEGRKNMRQMGGWLFRPLPIRPQSLTWLCSGFVSPCSQPVSMV